MIIQVRSYADMSPYTAHLTPDAQLDVPEGATVAQVLNMLQVPKDRKKIITVNGRGQPLDHTLHPGDELVFFPPLEGG